ncbi:MAG: hypothetical protein OEV91_08900 [Desulfobulbaceae bacterium]|nr:hypothetical protein [Desulfobulbaceae bacterium]
MSDLPPKKRQVAAKEQKPVPRRASGTFSSLIKPLVPASSRPVARSVLQSAPLAHLDYPVELTLKNEGLSLFWHHNRLPGQPDPVVASPMPRGYRTTSKRKALLRGSTLHLLFGDRTLAQKYPFQSSPLEPVAHERIFRFLQQKLSDPAFRSAAAHLNHLIVRGSYTERVVIFNVDAMNGPLVRKYKMLAAHLQKGPVAVNGAFIYFDPTRSDYYLESRRPDNMNFKNLFGPEHLTVSHGGCRYRYHPTSFSQINESMVGGMLEKALELLAPEGDESLLDLYCGYGLFSHFLAPHFRQVLGIDAEGPSIRAAAANSRLNSAQGGKARFLARRITGDLVDEVLADSRGPQAVILDPPRQGPQEGVIAALGRGRPDKVLHIFCGVDQIPDSLRAWQECGYGVLRILPLDMFPGSANLEVLVLLSPAGAGEKII